MLRAFLLLGFSASLAAAEPAPATAPAADEKEQKPVRLVCTDEAKIGSRLKRKTCVSKGNKETRDGQSREALTEIVKEQDSLQTADQNKLNER